MPTPSAPRDDAVLRFRADVEALAGPLGGRRIGIAVSGGADSLALLLLANGAFPGQVAAATVDHGLRSEAKDEAKVVGAICARLSIPHEVLIGSVPRNGNVQQGARILRYRLLADWAMRNESSFVATAHHRDDVAESFMMRAMRGSGIRGLARMRAIGPMPYASCPAQLLRPLLNWSRAELAVITREAGLSPAVDRSNADDRFDRVRIRKLLDREREIDPALLARSAENLQETEIALEWMAEQAWRSRSKVADGIVTIDSADLPAEIQRRLTAKAIFSLDPEWDGEGLDGLVAELRAGKAAMAGDILAEPRGSWKFYLAPPRTARR